MITQLKYKALPTSNEAEIESINTNNIITKK
jgi:hypothetical protein